MPNLKLLTKDIAEEYALEFDHLLYDYELIEDGAAEVLGKLPWFLWLNGLIEISEKSAEHLAKSPLGLNIGVTDLSNAAATALSKYRGWLQLNKLTYLSEGVCERLGHHQGWLCLHGLKSLSFSNAQLLSRHRGILCFGEDFKVSESVTKILVEHQKLYPLHSAGGPDCSAEDIVACHGLTIENRSTKLYLNHIVSLSDEDAKVLAWCDDGELFLDGLETLSDTAAEWLGQCSAAFINLNGLTSLPQKVAEALGKYEINLSLNGLASLSVDAAKALLKAPKNFLSLNGLTSLSKEFAEAIYGHLGFGWELNGLTEMSDEVANILLRNPWHLSFTGLTSISDCMVNHLKSIGPGYFTFGFNHLKVVTPKVINALADQAKGRHNDLNGLTSLSVEVAEALVKLQGDIYVNSLESLSPEVAEVLATHKGSLMLNGLRSLSPETAETLAKHEGLVSLEGLTELTTHSAELLRKKGCQHSLRLNALTSLPVEAAKILSRHRGSLELNGLSSVSSEAAHWLAKRGGRLYLHGLTSLSDELARIFAKRRGEISFDSRIKVSDAALKALTESDWTLILDRLRINSGTIDERILHYSRIRPIQFTLELTEEGILSRREAKALAVLQQDLDLGQVDFLPTEAAEELAKHQGSVMKLNGIRFLWAGAAEHLREYKGLLELLGLEQISPKVAENLGNCRGRMRIRVQEPLSDAAAVPLVDSARIWIDARMSPGMEKYCNQECHSGGNPTHGR